MLNEFSHNHPDFQEPRLRNILQQQVDGEFWLFLVQENLEIFQRFFISLVLSFQKYTYVGT